MNVDFFKKLAYHVDMLITARINQAKYDKTYSGIISEVLFEPGTDIKDSRFGTYKVRYAGKEQKIMLIDGLVHEVGERVEVCVPLNDPNRAVVYPTITRVIPHKIVYDREGDKFIEYRKTVTNGKTYELESVYELVVENKGQENEEVKKMICPDGSIINFENWDI